MLETHLKNNFYDWIPLKKDEKLLFLSEKMDNLEGMWDYIVISDAFAGVQRIFMGESPYRVFWEKIQKHLKPQGHVLLAIDNKYGLQYFAGCKERLTGKYFEGLEGYGNSEGIATFSKEAIVSMVKEAGFETVKTYYPYPNFRYMTTLYSDEYLPSPGELHTNHCNFEEERIVLFDEAAVYDGLIKEGKFQEFSNSFLFDCILEEQKTEEEILFIKYSVERNEKYRIRTEIVRKADGTKVVRKVPYSEEAKAHVRNIKYWEEVLAERYRSEGVLVNQCSLTDQGAEFEFLKGETLEEQLNNCLSRGEFTKFYEKITGYKELLERLLKPQVFKIGEKFREVFGEIEFHTPQLAAPINNIDLIFSNMIYVDGKCHIIDYEWTFDFQIPLKFIIHRAVYLYFEQNKPNGVECGQILRMLDISESESEIFLEMEHRLQLYLLGDTKTMAALAYEYAGKTINLKEILHRAHQPEMKIYQDFGQGLSEENSYVLEVKEDFYGRRRFALSLTANTTAIRLDPCEEPCMVTINRILGECNGSYELDLSHNGKGYGKSILYTTTDPQIMITGIVPGTSQIHVDMTVEYLKEETSYVWMKLLERAEKCDRIEASKPYRLMKKIKNLMKKG